MEESSIITIYRVIVYHSDNRIRNIFAFDNTDDATYIANFLRNYYSYIYQYRPSVKMESTSCIAFAAKDIVFIDGKKHKLSEVNHKMQELQTKLKNTNGILELLGEKPLFPQPLNNYFECILGLSMCFCCGITPRYLSAPVHYTYSVLKR